MKQRVACVAFAIGMLTSGLSLANTVIYTFTAIGNGSVAQTPFTNQLMTFTVTGNSLAVQNLVSPYTNALTGGSVFIEGTVCAGGCVITNSANYMVFMYVDFLLIHGISTVGHPGSVGQTLIEGCFGIAYCGVTVNDNLITNVPLTFTQNSGGGSPYLPFATSGGSVQIDSVSYRSDFSRPMGYSVAIQPVPVPAVSQFFIAVLICLVGLGAFGSLAQERRN
jgi:hypothetical protein